MIKLCKYNQDSVMDKIRNGKLDAVALSISNLIDNIILKMNKLDIFDCLKNNIPNLRAHNTTIPYELGRKTDR